MNTKGKKINLHVRIQMSKRNLRIQTSRKTRNKNRYEEERTWPAQSQTVPCPACGHTLVHQQSPQIWAELKTNGLGYLFDYGNDVWYKTSGYKWLLPYFTLKIDLTPSAHQNIIWFIISRTPPPLIFKNISSQSSKHGYWSNQLWFDLM